MNVLLISGKSGHGKDTFADFLEEKLKEQNKTILVIHFADLVKFYATKYFNYKDIKDETDRSILQYVGTHLMRAHYPTYWGRTVGEFLEACARQNLFEYVLIPDFRFKNEYDAIASILSKSNTLTTIRINRYNEDGSLYINPNMTFAQIEHISECELDNFNFEWIVENRDIEELELSADFILEHI